MPLKSHSPSPSTPGSSDRSLAAAEATSMGTPMNSDRWPLKTAIPFDP